MTRPNILWVVTTQWRAQACGYAGDANSRTPSLDLLASQALNFTQAVTPHPFGPFARAAMLTGRRSPQNGVRNYFDPLPQGQKTIAHSLRGYGYHTAFFGKWHLGRRDPKAPLVGEQHARIVIPEGERGGFEFWEGFESGFLLNDPWLHGTRIGPPTQFPGYQSDVLCDRARTWLGEKGGTTPWFCVISLEAPHPPYMAPAPNVPLADPYGLRLAGNVPPAAEPKARTELSGYYAHIEATDRAVGHLLERIDYSNTIVVFTSVHGDMHGAHGLFRKGWPHEESIRVPLLIRAPGLTKAVSSAAASLADLPRWTIDCAMSGVPPATSAPTAWISMPSVVELPYQCDRVWRGLRSPARKIVLNADGSPWFFFDLQEDPLEQNNLVGQAAHALEIQAWRDQVLDTEAGKN